MKAINKCKDDRNDFADLIGQSRENKLLSKEAIGLLHVIRNQRNIFAHATINPNTRYMRVIFLMAAFALLSEEIKQEYWENDNKLNPVLLIALVIESNPNLTAEQVEYWKNQTAIKRLGRIDEVVHGIIFCLDNNFFNGRVLDIDGGLYLWQNLLSFTASGKPARFCPH